MLRSDKEEEERRGMAEPDDCLSEVCKGVFVSSYKPAQNRELLAAAGITRVINAAAVPAAPAAPELSDDAEKVVHAPALELCLRDRPDTDITRAIPQAVCFIACARRAGHKVLVHCNMGCSRSGALAVAFVMKTRGLDEERALAVVRRARPCVLPNSGFMAQLRGWHQAGMPMGRYEALYRASQAPQP